MYTPVSCLYSLLHIYIIPIYINELIVIFYVDPKYLFVEELTVNVFGPHIYIFIYEFIVML